MPIGAGFAALYEGIPIDSNLMRNGNVSVTETIGYDFVPAFKIP